MTRQSEILQLQFGSRIGVIHGYRLCQRCLARHQNNKATHAIVHKRRWWELFSKTELVCEECAVADHGRE
jgi:hypothetical protein